MRKDGQRVSGSKVQFVWGGSDSKASDSKAFDSKASDGEASDTGALDGTVKEPHGISWQRRVLRRQALLIGSGALVLVAGAAYGVVALGTQQHHATTGAAAMTLPSSLIPARGAVSGLPTSPRASLSRSATPESRATAATHKDSAVAAPQAGSVAAGGSAGAQQQPGTGNSASAGTGGSPAAVGDWPLSSPASGSNSVADVAGSHPGTASNVQWGATSGVGSYGAFNGTSSLITTSGPVVDTGPDSSYTVSAWLYPVQYDSSDFMTAVSQDGGPSGDSGFYLSFSGSVDRWVFLVPGASAPAESTGAPVLNTWTHVVGVYDAADDQVRVYVDGTLEGTASYGSTYAGSTGSLVIGRAMYAGGDVDWFHGDVRDVEVFDQALSTSAVGSLG